MEEDTKPLIVLQNKCCSKCNEIKTVDKFIPKRNICKVCKNLRVKERHNSFKIDNNELKVCNTCNETKTMGLFIKYRCICKECDNKKRVTRYIENEEHRKKLIKYATEFKQKKVIERRKLKEKAILKLEEEIGEDNKICKYCNKVTAKKDFRKNRLKCKNCERDEPLSKLIRGQRSRILASLHRKTKHTIEYLGCNCSEYLQWIMDNNDNYTIENHGSGWHIDHVIPVSKFNLDDEEEQQLAFNWRNTTPLSKKENLSKNNKVIKKQIEQHLEKLTEYHKKMNIEFPEKFINLFAKHLDAGNP